MKKGWEVKRLADCCEIVNGGTPKSAVTAYWGGEQSWVTPAEMGARTSPYLTTTRRTLTTAGLKNSSARLLPSQSVILSSRAPIGHLVINTVPMATNQGCKGLVPKSGLESLFLYYCLLGMVPQLDAMGTGATFKELSAGKLKEVCIPVPPLPDQRRIVAILDEAFEGIAAAKANAERNLRNAREVFESQREHLLSRGEQDWDEKAIGEVCEIKHGFAFQSKYFTDDGGYVCLTPGNFFEDGGYRDRGSKTKYYSGPVPEGFLLSAGQMLVAMTEQAPGLLGSPAIVPEGQNFLHNQRLGLICPKQGSPWVNEFFFHVFNRPSFRRAVHRTATGVKVRHTSPSKMGQIGVSFPVSERGQRNVATAIDAIQQQASCQQQVIHQKLAALDELKASLLHQAFTDQL